MYDLHRLRLLRELSLRGTLAAVAEGLGYSPSAVSHQLSALERETRVKLLEPAGRGVRLTTAAQVLVEHTEIILRQLEMAEAAVTASCVEVGGTVRIAAFQTVTHSFVGHAMAQLSCEYPQLKVNLSHVNAEETIPGLIAHNFDIALTERYPGEPLVRMPGIQTKTLLADQLHLATDQSWGYPSLEDLAEAPWVMEHQGTSIRNWATTQCKNAGFEPNIISESSDVLLHSRLVSLGLAVAFLPGLALPKNDQVRTQPLGQSRLIDISRRTGSEQSISIDAVDRALRCQVDIHLRELESNQ